MAAKGRPHSFKKGPKNIHITFVIFFLKRLNLNTPFGTSLS